MFVHNNVFVTLLHEHQVSESAMTTVLQPTLSSVDVRTDPDLLDESFTVGVYRPPLSGVKEWCYPRRILRIP